MGSVAILLLEHKRSAVRPHTYDLELVADDFVGPQPEIRDMTFTVPRDDFKRASAESVTVVMPYFSYAKGDKKDEPRVSIRARVCADALEAAGADRIVTLDLHAPQIQGFFHIPVDDLYALPVLCEAIKRKNPSDLIVVAPDGGFAKKARRYASYLGTSLAIGDKERVDVILTNPPFGGAEEKGIQDNFPQDKRTAETALLFLQLIMRKLRRGTKPGRAAVVVPNGTLFGDGVCARIKEDLLREFNLHTIVRLPNGVFAPYTDINTNLLFFTKGEPTQEVWYFEHPLPDGYKKYTKTRPIRIEEFDLEKAWWCDRHESERTWRVPIEAIKRRNYNLDIKNPNSIDAAHGDPATLLAQYHALQAEIAAARTALKTELAAALESR